MPYSRINWKNGAAGGTPLNQTNLNKMDAGIKDNENAIASTNEEVATNAEAIAANAEAIEELKNKPTSAMLLESASPLEYATNNNIVGLYAEGNSTQAEGAPSPTNPIAIKDASGVVEAHTKNIVGEITKNNSTVMYENTLIATFPSIEKGKTYTISFDSDANSVLYSNENITNETRYNINVGHNILLYTVAKDLDKNNSAQYMNGWRLLKQFNNSGVTLTNVMIEEGTSASPYEPYKSNSINIVDNGIDLRSIPNSYVKDTLTIKEDGSGEWVQKVKSVKLTTVLGIGNANTDTAYARFDISDSALANYDTRYVCTHFGVNNTTDKLTTEGSFFYANNLRCRKSGLTTKAQWDEWISQNEVIFYYPLATPIVHTLTKEQVDAILKLHTYEGTTLIDTELQNVYVIYAGDTKKYVDEKVSEAVLVALDLAEITAKSAVDRVTFYGQSESEVGEWREGFNELILYRKVLKGTVSQNATTSDGQEVEWFSQKEIKMINGHVGMYPIQRYVSDTNYFRVDWFSLMMDPDYHPLPVVNIHCSNNYVGMNYEIVVYYTKPYENTVTPYSLDDSAIPNTENPTALEPTPTLIAEDEVDK